MNTAETCIERVQAYVETALCALDQELNENSSPRKGKKIILQGQALKSLIITSCNIAPYGIVMIHFGKSDRKNLESHCISAGDRVLVNAMNNSLALAGDSITGCVEIVKNKEISVTFDDIWPFDAAANNLFQIVKLVDDVTYNRMKKSLHRLLDFPRETENLTALLFGNEKLQQVPLPPAILDSKTGEIMFFNGSLQPAQKEAIKFSLKHKYFGIIHGPPGTGKTTTLVELIFQLVKSGEKVLVCAPSNVAVDNIMAKLQKYQLKSVRLGHPSRVSEENKALTVNAYFEASVLSEALKDAKLELQSTIDKLVMSKSTITEQRKYHKTLHKLRSEVRRRETKMASEALLGIDVCFATIGSSNREIILRYFSETFFGSVIIDEASQSLEPGCWMAMANAQRCVLAGDHHQLSPMILSEGAAQLGLGITLMERAIEKLGPECVLLLTHQFRMNEKIMNWVSNEIYGGQLTADLSVANHLLADIAGVEETDETCTPLLLMDTSGCSLPEHCHHLSYGNLGEADIVAHLANLMVKAGVSQGSICVITPYNRQVDLIKESLAHLSIGEIEVKTVDGYQGAESEAVILSLVRSNTEGSLGFVSDRRRINVAVSRARRLLCVVADSSTVGKDVTIASLIKHIRQHGQARSAHEILGDVNSSRTKTQEGADQKPVTKKKNKLKNNFPNDTNEPVSFKNYKETLQDFTTSAETTLMIDCKLTGFQSLKIIAEIQRRKLEYEVLDHNCIRVQKDPANEVVSAEKGNTVSQSNSDSKAKILEFKQLRTEIQQFLVSEETTLQFPPYLNAPQRALVHAEAEKLGLLHASVGVKENRQIVVHKSSIKEQDAPGCTSGIETGLVTDGERFSNMLKSFLSTEETTLAFPPNLTSSQQAFIEENAEMLGLLHTIVVRPSYVQLVVKKVRFDEQEESNAEDHVVEKLSNSSLKDPEVMGETQVASTSRSKKKNKKKPAVVVEVPTSDDNVLCEQFARTDPEVMDGTQVASTSRPKKKNKKKPAEVVEVPASDDTVLLEQLAKISGQCSSANCKVGVRLIGHDCPYCKQRYCTPHMLPEVHGCAVDAKKAARKEFVHPKPKSLSDDKKKALRKSLNSKLTAKADMRTSAKK